MIMCKPGPCKEYELPRRHLKRRLQKINDQLEYIWANLSALCTPEQPRHSSAPLGKLYTLHPWALSALAPLGTILTLHPWAPSSLCIPRNPLHFAPMSTLYTLHTPWHNIHSAPLGTLFTLYPYTSSALCIPGHPLHSAVPSLTRFMQSSNKKF